MATGGKDGPRAYEGDDEVDDYLLNQISKFVLYDKLGRLARDLGLNQAEYSRIAAVPNKPPEEQIFEVLSKWRQKRSSRKAKDVVSHVVEWQKDGYIDPVIWEHLTTKINLSMLPQPPQLLPYPLEEPHTEKDVIQYVISAFTDLKERLKDSLDREWRNCMSHDWISPEKAKSFPLRKFYVGLRWTKMVKGALKNYKQKLTSIYEILIAADTHMSKKTKAVGILATAEPGMGKTCSLALLALDWVDESQELLQLFDFVFLLQLRYTNKISTLPELIIMQHGKLKYSDLSLLQSILEGTTKHRVLIMMDGYDEYKRGTNKAVDRAIEFTMCNCFLILTSRPGFVSKQVRDKMDGEVIIEGFSPENIIECSSMYLGSRDLSNMMMAQAEECGIFDLLCIPIILLMVCVVFSEKESLPKTTTSLMTTIFEMIMDRSTLKKFGLKSSQLKELEALLYTLGEFSWKALQSDFQQLLLIKEQLLKQSPPLLDLGLLFETGIDVSSVRELSSFVSFHHKLLQEYSGSYFLERYLRNVNNIKETLLDLFPSMVHIRKYREVVIFLCGLMSDPTPIVLHVYEMCVQEKQQKMVEGENPSIRWEERHLFQSLYNESGIPLPGRPLHNAYINYYSHEFYEGELDTSPVHTPSQLFIFKYISKGMVCNYRGTGNGEELPNSAINVYRPRHIDTSKMMALLRTISQHQPISHLCLKKFHHEDFAEEDVLTLSNDAKTISLDACTLPQGVLLHLFQQLPNCAVLENLDIYKTDLEFMRSLDLSNLKSLTGLKLMATHLSPEVCQSVLGQISDLDRLIHLNLKMNCLAGSLSNFLPESHHSLPSLEFFSLANNDLKKSDLTQIAKLIEQLKIPNLHTLQLPSCELKGMENTLSELLEACITHHNKELTVTLWRNKLSKQFKETWKSRCEGTLITLQLVMPLGNYFMYSK